MIQLPKYIEEHLDRYGNAVVNRNLVRRMKAEKIIEILKNDGYDVEFHFYKDNYELTDPHRLDKETTCILSVKTTLNRSMYQ